MRYDVLTGQVQARARLPDRQSAERAVRATLETLAERVPDGVADHVAAQLPVEAGEALRRVTASHEGSPQARAYRREHGERFGLTGFAGRVAWRTGTSEEGALREAAAVFEVLDSAVSPELMRKVYAVLPDDIRELLPPGRALSQEGAQGRRGLPRPGPSEGLADQGRVGRGHRRGPRLTRPPRPGPAAAAAGVRKPTPGVKSPGTLRV
ncbi:DUF2267 domain-containing protein [Streptomyces sp. B1866]|uniref:DUF2267 domain-containing protein n=1 Tax=Streptomyces sp. B1866 TaxID=3075431 RepID=UPI00289015EE|nr:DUF2267 domain-containing protein [Streptomyces sp. B1866]MDT3398155.1 DUF2267 domain-containing protein [Streptomyces sp. B1866]